MILEIVLKDSTEFEKSDIEFELESIETITNVRHLTQDTPKTYTAYVDSTYEGTVVSENVQLIPRVDFVTIKDSPDS